MRLIRRNWIVLAPCAAGVFIKIRARGHELHAMDQSAAPRADLYEFACGTWRKNNPIPSDQARWGRFNELAEYNRQFLHNILEKQSANNPKRKNNPIPSDQARW